MRRLNRFGLVASLAVALVAAPAFASQVTVGQFLVEIAKAKRVAVSDGASAEQSLRSMGIALPSVDLKKGLTESDVTAIASAMGVRVTTTRPDAPFNENQVSSFIQSFGSELSPGSPEAPATPNSQGGSPGNSDNGKGKKKGHNKSASEPI